MKPQCCCAPGRQLCWQVLVSLFGVALTSPRWALPQVFLFWDVNELNIFHLMKESRLGAYSSSAVV